MTTIACNGRSMAGDGLVTDDDDMIVEFDCEKVWRLPDGSLLGGTGKRAALIALRDTLSGHPTDLEGTGEFDAMRLMPDGTGLWYCDGGGLTPDTCSWPCAMGAGKGLALGAMLAGVKPKRAIEIAAERNTVTGGKILVLHL